MNNIETYIVDAFTDEPFKGNPAGVCILDEELSGNKMLLIAQELGLSETAFVSQLNKNGIYAIRYFSPKMEIPLCGHATLAASKVLFQRNKDEERIHFVNIQKLDLIITREGEFIVMKFPVYDTEACDAPLKLISALGLDEINNSVYNKDLSILLLEIMDCEILRSLKPNFNTLITSCDTINGVLVTAKSNKPNYDFESRYFWPWSGTNEDPVTGGTHTFLAKYWGDRLQKTSMNSFQCSSRGGFMKVTLLDNENMTIKSKARIIFEGRLKV